LHYFCNYITPNMEKVQIWCINNIQEEKWNKTIFNSFFCLSLNKKTPPVKLHYCQDLISVKWALCLYTVLPKQSIIIRLSMTYEWNDPMFSLNCIIFKSLYLIIMFCDLEVFHLASTPRKIKSLNTYTYYCMGHVF
jgi:hypothetical protein